jgi:hypothetical protein
VLVGALVILAGPLSSRLLHQLDEGRPQNAVFPVTRAVSRALHEHVAQEPGVELTFMARSAVTEAIVIHIATDHQLSKSYANELRDVVRTTMDDPEMPVVIVAFDGQWRSDEEESESQD